jgi:hypothetical protein
MKNVSKELPHELKIAQSFLISLTVDSMVRNRTMDFKFYGQGPHLNPGPLAS